ncbi:MAG: extracellular solute-binding protein family 5 [Firmicutes bacterium]|nr:extracellular solute-binding protein family 5 [Bacillota bacterium]
MHKQPLTRTLTAAVLGAALILSGCSSGSGQQPTVPTAPPTTAPNKNAVINIALNADPPKLDPHQSTALVDRQVFASLFDKLVEIDKDLNFVPMLAEKWQISPDGKTYTFNLRTGVKFHDGTDFNAEAVVYNFERMRDPKLNSPRLAEIKDVDKVTALDPATVKIELKNPFSGFLATLSDRAGMMVSPTAAKAAGVDFLNNPVGTGPFKFKERIKGDSITLVKNESYWQQGLPKAAGVVYKTVTDENVKLVNLQSGQFDVIDTVPGKQVPSLKSDNRVKLAIGPGLGFQGLWLNVNRAPLDKKEVRQAINAAVDREALVKVVFGEIAVPGASPFPPGTPANAGAATPKRDVAKAKQLLADAGVTGKVTVSLKVSPSPVSQQIAQMVQQMLGDAGITVTIEQQEFGQILDKLAKKDFDMAQVGWSGRVDPDGNIYAFNYTGAGNNYAGYSNKPVDQLLDNARLESDMSKRKAIYGDIMKITDADLPYIYLWHPQEVKGLGPTVQGFVPMPDGLIRTATLTK